ncbi:odorant receptor 47a-like isoform X2 [Rhodnius prolixus]
MKKQKLPGTPEMMTPVQRAYHQIRFSGLILEKDNPKTIFFAVYHMFMVNYVGLASGVDLIRGNQSLIDFVQSLGLAMIYINNIVKATNILLHQKEIKELFARLDKASLEITRNQAEKHIELRPENLQTKFIVTYSKLLMWFPPFSFTTGLLSDYLSDFVKPHLPFPLWIPWRMTTFWSYLATMVFDTMLSVTTSYYYVSFTALLFTFTTELTACLRVLQHRLETNGPADKNVYIYHHTILELLQDYNKIFSGPVYSEILISALQPCGFLYAFIKLLKRQDPASVDLATKGVLTVLTPFVPCSCGQTISSQIERLHASAYMGKWYEEKPKVRRDLLTMLTVTTRQADMNYRKFISYNFVCYATVIQGIYSYLMMIIQIGGD